mgnify:CR=1 FL=1
MHAQLALVLSHGAVIDIAEGIALGALEHLGSLAYNGEIAVAAHDNGNLFYF